MSVKIKDTMQELFNIDLIEAVLSNSVKKDGITKIKIRPLLLKDTLKFQVTKYIGKQVFHENLDKEQLLEQAGQWFASEQVQFKQAQIKTKFEEATVLVSKKGKATIKRKKKVAAPQEFKMDLSHNRVKNYILKEGIPVPFLIDLGVMNKDGTIVRSRYDKFKQINRFLEFIEDVLPVLPKEEEVSILDFGCGKSYLTFAMYYYLHELKGYRVRIIGLDLKKDVI